MFDETFKGYIGRDWFDMSCGKQHDFEEFVKRHDKVFIKPLDGSQGKDINILDTNGLRGFRLEDNRGFIAEEIIRQHPKMAELNRSSVNTIRVQTFKGKVIACALRIGGKDSIVDNLHSKGVCGHLDLNTGVIDAPCINNSLEKYLFHPDSNVPLIGFQVPNWQMVISTAEGAAKVVPGVQYIGWDIAVTEEGTALIEGNHDPGHDVIQMIAQTGLYSKIRELEKQEQ